MTAPQIHAGITDSGTQYMRCHAVGLTSLYAYQAGDHWTARIYGQVRTYETAHGCRIGLISAMRRAARNVLPVDTIMIDALSDIAAGHNDPRVRAAEALSAVRVGAFDGERGEG